MRLRTLVRRFTARLPVAAGVLSVLVVAAFTVSANVFLDSQTLTPEQEVRWQLGDTDGLLRLSGVAAPAGSPARDQLERESGPTSAWTMSLQHYDFPVPQVAPDQVTFEEMPWGRRLFGSRYLLEEGRWPRRPGEVVVIGGSGRAAVGRSLAVLGDPDALRVVGTGRGAFARETRLLAASGTWGSLRNPRSGLSQLDGSILAFLDQGADIEQETRGLASLLSTTAVPHDYDATTSQVHQELLAGFVDAERVAREAPQRWTTASPLSFWVPSLTLGPMAVLVAFLSVSRRAGASLRSLVRAGVDQRTAVSGVTLAVMIWSASAAVAGGAAGGLAGYVAAMWGSRGLGNPAPVVSFPWAGAMCLVVSLLLGAAAGFLVLARVAGPASTREGSPVRGSATHGQWRDRGADLRRTVAVVAGAVLLFLYTRLGSADDLLWVSGLATLVMAMLVPEATRTLARRWPEGRLTGRLSARLLQANLTRACVLTAVFAVAVGLCGGFLAAFNTAVQSERAAAVNASPTDQVVLDNDGSPTLPVPAVVRRVAEAVPSLADQTPVQLYTVGRPARGYSGPPTHAVGVDTGYYLFNTLAFDEVGQVERAFATRLSKQERATLEEGGALVIDDRVPLDQGAATLADLDAPSTTYDLAAIRSSLRNQAISEAVGAVVLTRTAGDLGGSVAEGGLVYTGVTAEESARVRAALSQAGIHPEQAWIFVEPEPLLPDLALVGSAVGLSLTMLLVAWASTRAQLLSLRPWVSRLTQLGVSKRWALRAVGTQYAALVALGAGAGLLGSLLPLLAAPLVLPGLAIVVPWWETGVLLACLAVTVGLGCVVALRSLTYAEGAEVQATF